MLTHYLRLIARNLLRLRNQTSLNILGLAIGLAACFLILDYLRIEYSVDRHHRTDLYRVSSEIDLGEVQRQLAVTSPAVSAGLKRDFPEVMESARLFKAPGVDKFLVSVEELAYFEEQVMFADPAFFELLTYRFTSGDPDTALDAPFSVVVTEEVATKLFPSQSALGQSITIESLWGEDLYTITGVIDKSAYNTHIDGDYYVASTSGAVGDRFYELEEWGGNNLFYTFVLLDDLTTPDALEDKLPDWLRTYAADRLAQLGFDKRLYLEAMPDLYLHSGLATMVGPIGNATYFYTLGFVALLILLIACINFTNLATAKALLRAREVGVRQVVGAHRLDLVKQFFLEAFVYTLIAVALAWLLSQLAAPVFEGVLGHSLSLSLFGGSFDSSVLIIAIVMTTLLVGAYPALYLASFTPVEVLRGIAGRRFSAPAVRKALVVFQFVVSIALVQSILVINQQLSYIEGKDLGFDKQDKLVITNNSNGAKDNAQLLKTQLALHPDIQATGLTSTFPGTINLENGTVNAPGRDASQSVIGYTAMVDPEYMTLMQFELVSGRTFERARAGDYENKIVVNTTLAEALGYDQQSAIGQTVFYDIPDRRVNYQIIGVVADFNASALYNEVEGQMFFLNETNRLSSNYLVADVISRDFGRLITDVEAAWSALNPGEPFEYFLMEEKISDAYMSERQMSELISGATLLAILISCFGLYGLNTFAAERRRKEIALRKTIGADMAAVVTLLSRDFLVLVGLAFFIATPLSWYAMSQWLSTFSFHTQPHWLLFLAGGAAAVAVALLTIAGQALRAARLNPVVGLRLS